MRHRESRVPETEMPEQRSPLKEYRHLAEKLATVGLSPAEQARFRQLKDMVAPEPSSPKPGFDVNAAAEALRASLEPAGLRRPAFEEPGLDLGAPPPALDAAAGYDPGALDAGQFHDAGAAGWDPNAQAAEAAHGHDPGAPGWDPNQPYDPGAPAWDPNQPYDPGAPAWDPGQSPDAAAPSGHAGHQPEGLDPGGGTGLDPGSGAPNQGPADASAGWDPGAAGGYDPAAWETGTPPPPIDPAAAFDLNAPPFDSAAAEPQTGSWDAGAPDPAVRPYDLGPEAFDAAALPPPEPGPGSYDQASWDAVGPPEPAGSPPEGPPVEPDFVEAELVEAEPVPAAGPPGPDFFTPGPLTPDFTGAQPLDSGTFAEGEPASPGAPAGWPGTPGEGEPAPAEAGFEPAAVEPGPSEEAGSAADAVPLASPADFLSALEPATAPAPSTDAGQVAIEELPPVEVDVEEIAEESGPPEPPPARAVAPPAPPPRAAATPLPPAPPPPAAPLPLRNVVAAPPPATPGPDFGGPSPTFVTGEHRVVVHTLEGQVLRGTLADADLDAEAIPLVPGPGRAAESVAASRVKAIFFMLLPGGRPPPAEGKRVRVTFRDGRQVAGFSADYDADAVGFFMVPADSRTNTGRIWVYRAAVRQVSVS